MSAPVQAGYTKIGSTALNTLIRIEASRIFDNRAQQIRVKLEDEDGLLRVSLNMPLPLPEDGTAFTQVLDEGRVALAEAIRLLTSLVVGRVDVRITRLDLA